jgi:uncharacterized glyoxalase superfamily protein PhnB
MNAIVPYLNFNGNAAEALAFYSNALNGAVESQQTFGESPMDVLLSKQAIYPSWFQIVCRARK